MKRSILMAASTALLVSSCHVTEKTVSLADLDGEWNIEQAGGTGMTANEEGRLPYIGIDAAQGRIYGYSGCNRIAATADKQATGLRLNMNRFAVTMMACPDMDKERAVLKALEDTREARKTGKGRVALLDAQQKTVAVLAKRYEPLPVAKLKGRWYLAKVYGQPLPDGLEERPYVEFDTAAGTLSGRAVCNRMTGSYQTDGASVGALTIGPLATTRMMCKDMDTERNITAALERCRKAGLQADGHVVLYAAGGEPMLELTRK